MPIELRITSETTEELEAQLSYLTGLLKNEGELPTESKKTVKKEAAPKESKTPPTQSDSKSAKKTRYFRHIDSEDIVKVDKGESLEDVQTDKFQEVPKSTYETYLKDQTKQDTSDNEESKESKAQPTIEDVREVMGKAVQKGEKDTIKDLFKQFGAAKLSELAPSDYQEFVDGLEAVLT